MPGILQKARSTVDIWQFLRFFLGGVTGAAANLLAVFIVRKYASYEAALAAGVIAGFIVSFFMAKLFAFQERSFSRTHAELVRFIIVYMGGICCYLFLSWMLGREILPNTMSREWAEMIGAFCGTASMTLTSYFGHRYFTYRHLLAR